MLSALFCRVLDFEKYSLTISCLAIILNFSSDCAICRFLFAFLLYLYRGCLQQCNHHCIFEIIIFVYYWRIVSYSLSVLFFVNTLYSGV